MTKISKDEVKKVAQMSALEIHDDEIEPLIKQLEDVLTYAERVQDITTELKDHLKKNTNVFREDKVITSDAEALLERAPEREDNFFVVPAIIEDK